MTHLTGREMADPRQQQQREGRMHNLCWHHTVYTHTATVRQVQLSQVTVADDVTNASPHKTQAEKGRSIFFIAGKFCVTELPYMGENKISLRARIQPANRLVRIPAAYGPRFLLQFLAAQGQFMTVQQPVNLHLPSICKRRKSRLHQSWDVAH